VMQKLIVKAFSQTHRWLHRLSGGVIGGNVGAPVLLLTTTGRKSGKRRETPLLCLAQQNGWVVAATNNGSKKEPIWSKNLRAEASASVRFGREDFPVRSREASDAEVQELWPRLVEMYAGFEKFAAKAQRKIPVFVLEKA